MSKSYNPEIWDTTSDFTPTKMNHLESGIEAVDLTGGGEVHGNLNVIVDNSSTTMADSYITAGNNIPEGTAGNTRGALGLYSKSDKVAVLVPTDLTEDRILYLPDKGGVLATGDVAPNQANSQMTFGIFQQTFAYQGTTYQNVNIAGVKIESPDFTPSRWTIFGYVLAGADLFGRFVCISSVDLTHAVVIAAQ